MKNKSQSSHQIKAIDTHQSPSQNNMNKKLKGNILQSDDVMFPNKRVRKLQNYHQDFEKFATDEVFRTMIRQRNQRRMIKILITIKYPSFINSKLLLAIIIQAICSIF